MSTLRRRRAHRAGHAAPKQVAHDPSRWRLGIEAALVGGVVVSTLLVSLLVGWQIAEGAAAGIRTQMQMRLAVSARDISLRLTAALDERLADVQQVRDLLQALPPPPGEMHQRILDKIPASHPQIHWLGIADLDGTVQAATDRGQIGLAHPHLVARDLIEIGPVAIGDRHATDAAARDAPVHRQAHLDISLPLASPEGQRIGTLVTHIDMSLVGTLFAQSLGPPAAPGFAATLMRRDGTVLHDTAGHAVSLSELRLTLLSNGTQAVELAWPGESARDRVYAASHPLRDSVIGRELDWTVVVREPADAIHAAVVQARWQAAMLCLAGGTLLCLIALLLVRRVTRPLRTLVTALRRFGERDGQSGGHRAALPRLPSTRLVEIELLKQSFETMTAAVQTQQDSLQQTQLQVLQTLGRAGEFRDNETGDHVQRMSRLCARLARLAGLPDPVVADMRLASQLHDIGKIGIPDHILLKPGRLTDDEREVMSHHPQIGARILSGLDAPMLRLARDIALTHHERWDGTGYPDGLAGEAIPIAGRIVAICDVFDALRSNRPYKRAWPLPEVLAHLREQSGSHFDPHLVGLFLDHLDEFIGDDLPPAEPASEAPSERATRAPSEASNDTPSMPK